MSTYQSAKYEVQSTVGKGVCMMNSIRIRT